jgi:imidazolonepropionase-like amidohydrolase
MRERIASATVGALLTWSVASPLGSQDRPADRRRYLDTTITRTTDDPRRTPIPPERRTGPEPVVVVRNGRLFDGTGTAAREGTLVITGNRITAILPSNAPPTWPRDARVIDAAGKTVMPGLIDLHTHLSYVNPGVPSGRVNDAADGALRGAERLRYFIETGVTSIRDVGSFGNIAMILNDWVREDRIPGPRVFPAGQLIVGLGGHGAEGDQGTSALGSTVRIATGPDDWRRAVREQFNNGADVIKVASHFSSEEISAAVSEAHALGLRITCDCETFYVDRAVDAGVDMIEHPLPRSDEIIAKMAAKGVASDPTLVPYEIIFDQSGGYWGSTSRRFTFSKQANLEMLRRLRRAGVKLGIGTDLVTNWFRYLPGPYLLEMQRFQEAGFSPAEVLAIATRQNAELLDMSDRLGTLTVGKLADVLIVNGRPDVTLDDITKVDVVIRNGTIVVENGRVSIPRHVPLPMPKAGMNPDGTSWR